MELGSPYFASIFAHRVPQVCVADSIQEYYG